ncbi:MAG: radical SAM protein [Candidatus Brocadiia bacterium]
MLKSILETIIEKAEKSLIPLSAHLEITRQCNLRCKHCYQIKSDCRPEMPTEKILNVIDELRNSGCLYLLISGGEPLVRQDFLDICRKAHKSNLAIHIATNGTLINNHIVAQLSKLNIMDVSLSIYGACPETHDRITGKDSSFKQTISAIELLKKYRLNPRLKFIMMRDNITEYESMIKISSQLAIPYDMDPLITPCDNGDKNPLECRLSDNELSEIYRKEYANMPAGPETNDNAGCSLGKSHCAINAYGDVYPCIQLPISAGNIMKQSFKDIWDNSKLFQEIRQYSNSRVDACKNCANKVYCRRCPGLAFVENGDILSASSETCRHALITSQSR